MKTLITTFILFFSIYAFAQITTTPWGYSLGGTNWDEVNAVSSDGNGNYYVSGKFQSTIDLDPSSGQSNHTSNGGSDIFIAKYDAAGAFVWSKSIGGSSSDYPTTLVVNNNEIIIGGVFQGTNVDFDPGSGVHNLSSAGSGDAFVLKLTSDSGSYVWAKSFGGSSMDNITSLDIASNGDIYCGGSYYGTADFDPSPTNAANKTSNGNSDMFINHLSSTGTFVGVTSLGGTDDDQINSLKINSQNQVVVAGTFRGTVDFDPTTSTANLTTMGYMDDVFIGKYTATGNYTWAKNFGTYDGERMQAMCLDPNDNIVLTGDFYTQVDFDPGPAIYYLSSHSSGNDIYVLKLNTSGNFVWAKAFGGNYPDLSQDISTDSQGNIYTFGNYSSQNIDLNPNADSAIFQSYGFQGDDLFLQKLDANGDFIYAKTLGGSWFESAATLTITSDNKILLGGNYESDTLFFSPSKQDYIVPNGNSTDGFIIAMDQSLELFTPAQNQFNNPPFNLTLSNNIQDTTNLRWFWNFGDGQFSTLREPQHTYAYNGQYELSLLIVDTISGSTDTATELIVCTGGAANPCTFQPVLNQSQATIKCAMDSFKLSVDLQSGQNISWFLNGISINGAHDSVLYAVQQGFYMAVVSQYGCSKTTPYFPLANYPYSIPGVASSGSIQACTNDSMLIYATPNYQSYLWSNGETSDSIYVHQSGRYTCMVQDEFGCNIQSPEVVVNASGSDIPSLCMIGYDSINNHNIVVWNNVVSTTTTSYKIYRETTSTNTYQLLGTVAYGNPTHFTDNTSNPAVKQYRYRVSAVDSCNTETPMSLAHSTMHLMVNATLNDHWNLIWKPYEGIAISSYQIFRGTDSTQMQLIASISGNATSYSDMNNPAGDIFYKVKAISNANCGNFQIVSNSFNTKHAGGVYIHNANNISTSISLYPNPSKGHFILSGLENGNPYTIKIYDIYGRILFAKNYATQNSKIEVQSNLPKGVYFVNASINGKSSTHKLIIQ